jgi:hypothetical protein
VSSVYSGDASETKTHYKYGTLCAMELKTSTGNVCGPGIRGLKSRTAVRVGCDYCAPSPAVAAPRVLCLCLYFRRQKRQDPSMSVLQCLCRGDREFNFGLSGKTAVQLIAV